MSKQSYINGFCKAAADNGLDPEALARFAVNKEAQAADPAPAGGKSEIWGKVMEATSKVKDRAKGAGGNVAAWYGKQKQATKALVGAGLGSAVGTGLGAALAGKKGLRSGAILGALGGGVGAVDWKELSKSIGSLAEKAKASSKAKEGAKKNVQN